MRCGPRAKAALPVVLVVDDVEDNVDLFCAVLGEDDIVVRTARDGCEALELAAREPPTVVVTDIAMPCMDGIELTRRLRDRTRAGDDGPYVIVVSAFSDSATRAAAREAGADEVLAKPCAPDLLAERVLGALKARDEAEWPIPA